MDILVMLFGAFLLLTGLWGILTERIRVAGDVKPWRYPPRFDFQYGDWLRGQFESGDVAPWPTTLNPDLAILLTMVRLGDAPLFGPPPSQIFDPVPQQDLIRAMVSDLDRLRDDLNADTRNVILTLARIWSSVATGDIRAKDAAADWALDRLPPAHCPVLARARAIYLGDQTEQWGDLAAQIAPHADHVIAEIRGLVDQRVL